MEKASVVIADRITYVVVGLKASVWEKELSLARLRTFGTAYFSRRQYNAVMRSETLLRN